MFLFKKYKSFNQKQTAIVGFVLAVMSILVTAVVVYGFPQLSGWLYANGIYQLDLFLLAFVVILFLSAQGLILFGFPLYYAQDKKSHMTGFQILLYALGWMILLVGIIAYLTVVFKGQDYSSYDMSDFEDMFVEDQTTEPAVE